MKFLLTIASMIALCALNHAASIAIKSGQKAAFLGDSITEQGWNHTNGYVRLALKGLAANDINIEAVPAGISGHKSNDMLKRLDHDVLSKKPDWLLLSCGVNDVWHGAKGVPLDQYKENIRQIVDQAQAAGIKVMILTATVIGEELDNENNKKLAFYNDFLRKLARSKKCRLADLNRMFQDEIERSKSKEKVLTKDGVHMNAAGDQVMATGILKAFGLNKKQLKTASASWAP
jgi:lysophospholipase L1-like esterase